RINLRVASLRTDICRCPFVRLNRGVACGTIEVVARELAGIARVGGVVTFGDACPSNSGQPGLFADRLIARRSPWRRIDPRGTPRRTIEDCDRRLVQRNARALKALGRRSEP